MQIDEEPIEEFVLLSNAEVAGILIISLILQPFFTRLQKRRTGREV